MAMAEKLVRKTVIINRAVPGSGKTTISRCIKETLENRGFTVAIHSTDDYFLTGTGAYQFDIHKLAEFHAINLQSFQQSINREITLVICDNTNLAPWEAEPYSAYARAHNYQIVIIDYAPRELAKHLAAQQVTPEKPDAHNIPENELLEMIGRYHKYYKYLNRSRLPGDNVDYAYAWSNELLTTVLTREPVKNYDHDCLLMVLPNQYQQAKSEIPSKILAIATGENNGTAS